MNNSIKTEVKFIMRILDPKRIVYAVISVILLIAIGTCVYAYSLLAKIKQTNIKPSTTVNPEVVQATSPVVKVLPSEVEKGQEEGITNIALFGLDGIETETCRSDTIMIATIDRDNKKIKLTSLMRDIYVEIPGKWKDKINAAYAYGGPALAMETINKNFDIDIKYYVAVDFKGVQSLVDVLGGTDINVKEGEISHINSRAENQIKSSGLQHLDGQQTLAYMRIRYFGNGDYERTERQRTVLSQLYSKAKNAGILKLGELLSSILPFVETNMSKVDIMNLALDLLRFSEQADLYRIPVDGTFSEEIIQSKWVIVPNLKENTEQLHKFIYNDKKNIPDVD